MTRRSVLRAGGVLLLGGGLAACGGKTGASKQGARTVASVHGPVAVPARAERVVCLDLSKIQRMLDVGVVPVGAPTGWQPTAEHSGWYDGAAKIGTQAAPDVEAVAVLRPDLVLGSPTGVTDDLYARLSALAPTVLLEAPGAGARWKELSAADAGAAGRGGALAPLRARYDARVAELWTAHAAQLARLTWAIVYGTPDGAYALLPDAGPGIVLTDLGARFGRLEADRAGVFQQLSYELVPELSDADVLVLDADTSGRPTAAGQALQDQPTFAALQASRAGSVHPLSHLLVFSYGEALALLDQLDDVLTWAGAS